jgi:hypothetical protein
MRDGFCLPYSGLHHENSRLIYNKINDADPIFRNLASRPAGCRPGEFVVRL